MECEGGDLDLIFGVPEEPISPAKTPAAMTWQLPAVKPKSLEKGGKPKVVVTGLASLLKEKF